MPRPSSPFIALAIAPPAGRVVFYAAVLFCAAFWPAPHAAAQEAPPPPPVVASEPAPPPPASAEPSEADRLGESGREAYREGRYADAYRLFEQAHARDQKPAWLYNMGRTKEKLAEYKAAVALLGRYLEAHRQQNGGADAANAADVNHLVRDLQQRAFEALPEVSIASNPTGAQVLLGPQGPTIGSTPLTTHMEPGTYPLVLRLPEHGDLHTELVVPQSGAVRLVLSLESKQKRAALSFWANVRGAQIAVDGQIVAVTPFAGRVEIKPGKHQISLQRAGYEAIEQNVDVPQDRVLHSRLRMRRTSGVATWRSWLGWPLAILGGGAIGGGGAASFFAEREYTNSPKFKDYEALQNAGYVGGGTAVGVGLALIVWDGLLEGIPDDELVEGEHFLPGAELRVLGSAELRP